MTRAINLPRGLDLIWYTHNKLNQIKLSRSNSLEVARPSSVMIELTNICNLKCITCAREYQFGKAMKTGLMDYDLLKRIVDELYPCVDSIGLTGLGETLLYNKLPQAVDYIRNKSKGIITFISSNAHLNNIEKKIEPLAGKIDTLQISIDGIGEVYNSIRHKGDFDFFRNNLEKIGNIVRGTRTDLMLNAVIFEKNYHQMTEIIEMAASLNIAYVYFNSMNLVATDWPTDQYSFYLRDEFKTELKKAIDLAVNSNVELSIFDFNTPPGFPKCGFPWNHFYITWDGYVVPCCAKPFPLELNFGNVAEDSFLQRLNSDSFKHFRKLWRKNQTPEFCQGCHMTDIPMVKCK